MAYLIPIAPPNLNGSLILIPVTIVFSRAIGSYIHLGEGIDGEVSGGLDIFTNMSTHSRLALILFGALDCNPVVSRIRRWETGGTGSSGIFFPWRLPVFGTIQLTRVGHGL